MEGQQKEIQYPRWHNIRTLLGKSGEVEEVMKFLKETDVEKIFLKKWGIADKISLPKAVIADVDAT